MAEGKALALPGFGEGTVLGGMNRLSVVRQVGLMVGLAASVALGIALVMWSRDTDYRPLGTLDQAETLSIINYFQSANIPYKLDSSGVVMVPSADFQQLKLQLAQQGLMTGPASGEEILKQDSGFGVSQKLENARLLRSREMELARTIEKIAGVKAATVNLAIPRESVFVKDRQKPSASVMLSLFSGRTLDPANVQSIVNYVASSVPNLEASRVTIIDHNARLLNSGSMSAEDIAHRREYDAERKREEDYALRVQQILEPLVGHGRYTVQVDVDMDFSQNEQTQQLYNPEPVVRSESTSENPTAGGGAAGVPGALTNQPPQDATTPEVAPQAKENGQGAAGVGGMRRDATRNYELDTTISHTRQQTGVIRRLSVSVGLDYKDGPVPAAPAETPAEGEAAAPVVPRLARDTAEIENITRLVKAAVGFSAQRGDTVEVLSFPFTPIAGLDSSDSAPFYEQPWFELVLRYGGLALGLLLIVFGVLRPLMHRLAKTTPPSSSSDIASLPSGDLGLSADELSLSNTFGGVALPPPVTGPGAEQLARARSVAGNDPALVAQLVKNWINES